MNGQFRPSGFRILPPVVKNLLILNGIFFLATIVFDSAYNIRLSDYLGLHYFAAEKFAPYQIVTYMFMHGGFAHLFFNMFALWMFGNALENVWGGKRFLIYYLVTGIGAALIHYLIYYFEIRPELSAINHVINNPGIASLNEFFENYKILLRDQSGPFYQSYLQFEKNFYLLQQQPDNRILLQEVVNFMAEYKEYFLNLPNVVGASGAVFGILLAFGMLFPNALIYLYFAIPIKAKWFVIIYGAIELYLGFSNNPGDNVAHFAHLGGMIFGFFLIKYWKRR